MGIIGFLILDRLGLRATPSAGAGPTGLVLMAGAAATLLAQWGIIPFFRMGPRTSCLWGMGMAALGTAMLSVAGDIHSIALGMILASLGFGMFRPGFTSGASLAVSRAEHWPDTRKEPESSLSPGTLRSSSAFTGCRVATSMRRSPARLRTTMA